MLVSGILMLGHYRAVRSCQIGMQMHGFSAVMSLSLPARCLARISAAAGPGAGIATA